MELKDNELLIDNLDDLQPQAAIRKTDLEDLKEGLSTTGSYIFYQNSFDIFNLMVTDKKLAMTLLEKHAKEHLNYGMDNEPNHDKKYLKLARNPTRKFIKDAEKFFMNKTDDSENYAAYLMGLFNWNQKKAFDVLKKSYTMEFNQYKKEIEKDGEYWLKYRLPVIHTILNGIDKGEFTDKVRESVKEVRPTEKVYKLPKSIDVTKFQESMVAVSKHFMNEAKVNKNQLSLILTNTPGMGKISIAMILVPKSPTENKGHYIISSWGGGANGKVHIIAHETEKRWDIKELKAKLNHHNDSFISIKDKPELLDKDLELNEFVLGGLMNQAQQVQNGGLIGMLQGIKNEI